MVSVENLKKRHRLTLPQVRVMDILVGANGPISRKQIASRLGSGNVVYVGKAIGPSNPEHRAAFEKTKFGGGRPEYPCFSLLSLGYVEEITVDVDGITETGIILTPLGREAFESLGEITLPPLV